MITGWKLVSIIMGYVAIAAGAVAVASMLGHKARGTPARRARALLWVHRVAGYVFFVIVIGMIAAMLARLPGYGEAFNSRIGWHVAEGFALVAFVTAKWSVVRLFRSQMHLAATLGLTLFGVIFSMVNLTATVDILTTTTASAAADRVVAANMAVAAEKCGHCHSIKRVFAVERSGAEWDVIVRRMRGKRPGWIAAGDARRIVSGLTHDYGPAPPSR